MKSFESTIDINAEQLSSFEKISNFNAKEKIKNIKELAKLGFKKIKNLFHRVDNAVHSFVQDKFDTTNIPTIPKEDISIKKEILDTPQPKATADTEIISDTEQAVEKNYTTLKELNGSNKGTIKFDLYQYYKENHIDKITDYAEKRILQHKLYFEDDSSLDKADQLMHEVENQQILTTETNKMIETMIQKRIVDFEDHINHTLQVANLSPTELVDFWKWRAENPPQEKALLINDADSGVQIKYDTFASNEAIQQFLKSRAIVSPDETFITTEDIEQQITDSFSVTQQTKDAPKDVDNTQTQTASKTTEQIAYDIEKYSNGWVDYKMYESVADIPAQKAIQMLGGINTELQPAGRKILSEMRYAAETQETFGDLVKNILDDSNDDADDTERKLHSLSNIVNKLNKVIILSEQS